MASILFVVKVTLILVLLALFAICSYLMLRKQQPKQKHHHDKGHICEMKSDVLAGLTSLYSKANAAKPVINIDYESNETYIKGPKDFIAPTRSVFMSNTPNQRFVVADLFLNSQRELFLISTFYHDQPVDFHVDVSVSINNSTPLVITREIVHHIYEPVRLICYKIPDQIDLDFSPNISVKIQFRQETPKTFSDIEIVPCPFSIIDQTAEQTFSTDALVTLRSPMAIATLFLNDYHMIPTFYQYYRAQGVTDFYLYYNGKLTQELLDKFPQYPGIYYHEFNIDYWTQNCKDCIPGNAQMAFITMAFYKYKPQHKYMIFNDLDEFIHDTDKNFTILQRLESPEYQSQPFVCARNIWSRLSIEGQEFSSLKPLDSFSVIPDKEIIRDGVRSKIIYRFDFAGQPGIHYPAMHQEDRDILTRDLKHEQSDLLMYHVIDGLHKERLDWIKEPQTEIKLL